MDPNFLFVYLTMLLFNLVSILGWGAAALMLVLFAWDRLKRKAVKVLFAVGVSVVWLSMTVLVVIVSIVLGLPGNSF